MKRMLLGFVLIAVTPLLLAMGITGGPPAMDRAPIPKIDFDAIVVDMEGTRTEISSISYNGEVYLPVYRGQAVITIPFKKISRIEFNQKVQNRRLAKVIFTNQKEEMFRIDDRLLFVGKLPFGTYQIQAKDVDSITFLHPPPESPAHKKTKEGGSH